MMGGGNRRQPSRWLGQFRPPDNAKSNEEVLKPFYDALEACPSGTKLHCAMRFGFGFSDTVDLSGIDKSAQGESYLENCWENARVRFYQPHVSGAMKYAAVERSGFAQFSGDEWASIVNAVTKCPVLEELEIENFPRVIPSSIRKFRTVEKLILIGKQLEHDKFLFLQLFLRVSQTGEDPSMLNKLVWIFAGHDFHGLYEVFIALLENSRLNYIELHIVDDASLWSSQDLIDIFEALQGNKHLQKLDMTSLKMEKDLDVRKTLGKLLDLIGHDFYVEEILLPSVLGLKFKRVEDEVRKNGAYASKGMELISPESSRVFVCGRPYVGKTELLTNFREETWLDLFLQIIGIQNTKIPPRTNGIEVTRLVTKGAKFSFWDFGGQVDYHYLHDLFIPSSCESGGSFVILCSLVAQDESDGRVKVGDTGCMFKGYEEIKKELEYWLRFIVSNSKISEKFKPFITLVFTHVDYALIKEDIVRIKDKVGDIVKLKLKKFGNSIQVSFGHGWSFIDATSKESVKPLLEGLVDNARKMLQDGPRVYQVCVEIEQILMQWNEDNPKRPLIKMSEFQELCKRSPSIRSKSEKRIQELCKAVALALHNSGNVIYFESLNFVVVRPNWFSHQIMGRILSLDAMSATSYNDKPVADENGFVKMEKLKDILDGSYKDGSILTKEKEVELDVEDLIQVMKEMNLCYEVVAKDRRYDGGLFIPATLRNRADEDKMIKWQVEPSCSHLSSILYLGYRLQCEDEDKTVLTQGFFPRVQVEFMKHFRSNANCVVKHNIISLRYDGKEVIVEYCGKSTYDHMDGYIDVLVKSSKSKAETSVFTKKVVMGLIKEVCYSANIGCPGVLLVESILNPEFVKKPSRTQDRKNQAERVDKLIRAVKSKFDTFRSEETFNLDYDHEWPYPGGRDKAEELLGDDEWQGLIHECCERFADKVNKQHQALEAVKAEVSLQPDDDQPKDGSTVDANERGFISSLHNAVTQLEEQLNRGFDAVNHRVDTVAENSRQIPEKLDKHIMLSEKISELENENMTLQWKLFHDTSRNIEKISDQVKENTKLQKKLVLDISRNIEMVMDFSIHLQRSQVPRLMFTVNKKKRLVTVARFVPGLKSVQVHFMCEHINEIHVVEKQKGCKLLLSSENFQSALPYVIWGVRAISLLVKIGGIAIGAGLGSLVEGVESELIKGLAGAMPSNAVPSNMDEGVVARALLPEDLKASFPAEEQKAAEQWLVDFLSNKSIPDLFDLHRIRYTCGSNRLAWVCGEHKREGERDKTMEIVPA